MVKTFNKAIKSRRADKIAAAYNETIASRHVISQEDRAIAIMSKQLIDAYEAYTRHINDETQNKFLEAYDAISKHPYRDIIVEQEMRDIVARIRNPQWQK